MRHFWLSLLPLAIILCGLLSGMFASRPVAAAEAAQRADIAGTVIDEAGKPVQGAAVRVLYAWTRVRNTPHCASCWADCGKTAIGDTAGGFKIESLDPQLVFRLLFVAKGYEPKFVDVDPQKDNPLKVSLKARPALPNDPRQIVTGKVVDSRGRPIAEAIIEPFDYMRGKERLRMSEVRGSDPLAVADAQGRFQIVTNLPVDAIDVKVTARAVAEKNFELAATPKSDNRLVLTEGATVRGRVVDHRRPAAGVKVCLVKPSSTHENLIGPFQIGPFEIGTDSQGEFLFANVPPDQDFCVYGSVDELRTRSGTAQRQIHVGADGSETKVGDLAVEGATIRGRVVDHGRSIADVKLRIEQVDYDVKPFVASFDVSTDGRGDFLFANLPPGRDYYVYGTMDNFRERGSISARQIHAGADGSDTKVVDLVVGPAYRISGRIVLSDGKPLPPHLRIQVDRRKLADSQTIGVDPNGAFNASGIPPELIGLQAQIDGYRLSDKNRSLEPYNAASLMGLVQKDIDGLLVLFEPGSDERIDPETRSSYDWDRLKSAELRIKNDPLMGVVAIDGGYRTAGGPIVERPLHPWRPLTKIELPPPMPPTKPVSADANVPKRAIVGRIVNQLGKPIAGADVWYRVRLDAAPGEFTVHTKSGAEGQFKLEFPIQWLPKDVTEYVPPRAVGYAPGYAIAGGDVASQVIPELTGPNSNQSTPVEIELGPECDAAFTVLTPDGKPLAGARVGPPWVDTLPELAAKICGTTDEHGRARIAGVGTDKLVRVMVGAAGYGSQSFNLDAERASNGTLQLAPVGRIEGRIVAAQPELFRGMTVSITTRQRMLAAKQKKNLAIRLEGTGQAELHVDADGRFVVPEIAAGQIFMLRAQIADERLPVRPRVIERNQVEVMPGKTARIEIPLEMLVKVHGLIRAKETGKPVAGAVILVNSNQFSLRERVVSDANGRFSATALSGDVVVAVIDVPTEGVRQSKDSRETHYEIPDDATEFELPVVEVEKCKNVAGLLLDKDGKPAPSSSVQAFAGEKMYFVMAREQGKFEFRDVPEGTVFDRFRIGSTGPSARDVPFTIQSKDPLVLRLK